MIYITWTTLVIFLTLCLSGFFYYQLVRKSKKLEEFKQSSFNRESSLKMNSEKVLRELKNTYDNQTTQLKNDYNNQIKNLSEQHSDNIKSLEDSYHKELEELEKLSLKFKENVESKYSEEMIKMEKQLEIYQKYILGINNVIKMSSFKLKELDHKETFKSDDEIGFFFSNVLEIQRLLDTFQVELISESNK